MKVKLYKKTKKEFFVEIIYILLIFQIALQSILGSEEIKNVLEKELKWID